MTDRSAPDPFQVLRSLRKLDSADPIERQQAILTLSNLLDDPRILDMLRQKAENDSDPQVRELARTKLASTSLTDSSLPPLPLPNTRTGQKKTAQGLVWTCQFCATPDISGDTCPSCGASRTTGKLDPQPASIPSSPTTTAEIFVYYPSNRAFVEGRAKQPGTLSLKVYGCWLAALLFVFVSSILIFLGVTLPNWKVARELDRSGVITEAKVYDRRILSGDDSDSYYVSYEFTVLGADGTYRDYQREQQVSWNHYSDWAPGKTVRVRYLPRNPAHSELVDDSKENTNLLMGMICSVGAAAIVLIILVLVWEYQQHKRLLLREGRLVQGQVISCSSHEDSDSDLWVTLHYRFSSPLTGKQIAKKVDRVANDLRNVRLPQPGDPVIVFYRNDQHFTLI